MFSNSIIISTDSASYFLKMIMLISLVGICTLMGAGRANERSVCLPYGKIPTLYSRFIVQLLFPQTQSLISLK